MPHAGSKEELDVPSVRLEDEVKEDVLLLKVGVRVKREKPCEVSGKHGNGNASACT